MDDANGAAANGGEAPQIRLTVDQRRILGVLIEKSLTTPQGYPLTVNAILTGCNQKSNRDPVFMFVDEQVEEVLEELRAASLVTMIQPAGGRVEKWRQEFTRGLELDGQQMAIVGELLLRGAQTLGELRSRASRMKPIPDQRALEEQVSRLSEREPPLVVRLSPEGVRRGVRITHNFYTPADWEEVRTAEDQIATTSGLAVTRAPRTDSSSLTGRIAALEERMRALEERLGVHSEEH